MIQTAVGAQNHTVSDLMADRFGSHPKPMRHFLAANVVASRRFVNDAPLRKTWFESHSFRPMASLCVDGRVQDFSEAIGLPTGVLEVFRSDGAMINCRSIGFSKRVLESVRRTHDHGLGKGRAPMVSMFMCVAHYSHSHPTDASCAAWEHQTAKALQAMQENADQLNRSYAHDVLYGLPRRLIAFPVLVDTDLDAVSVIGPEGRISVRELVEKCPPQSEALSTWAIVAQLRRIFPEHWRPLVELAPQMRTCFFEDLAELLRANIAFVQRVIDTKRPIELLVHQERLVFVGRHADWNTEHNTVFLIDDDNPRLKEDFAIAVKHVAKNILIDAIEENNRDWIVPIVINVPHDGDDRLPTEEYVRLVLLDLKAYLPEFVQSVAKWLSSSHGLGDIYLPVWVLIDIEKLAHRVMFHATVSDRSTRLFVPISES